MSKSKYFNNQLDVSKIILSTVIKNYPELRDYNNKKAIMDLVADLSDSSGKFHCLLTPLIFDKTFIYTFYYKVLVRTQSFFPNELSYEQKKALSRLNPEIRTKISTISDNEAQALYFKIYDKLKYTNKNHLILFSRALYYAFIGAQGVLKDCAQAIACIQAKTKVERFSDAYMKEIEAQRRILIELIFLHYPNEVIGFEYLREIYEIKSLLKL